MQQIGNESQIAVAHRPSSGPSPSQQSLYGKELSFIGEDCNTCTRITVSRGSTAFVGYFYWQSDEASRTSFHLLLLEETGLLFVGMGGTILVINTLDCSMVEHPCLLFWSFELRDGCVLARTEIEALLFSTTGALLSRVDLDPPWTERQLEGALEFDCIVFGRQVLRWP